VGILTSFLRLLLCCRRRILLVVQFVGLDQDNDSIYSLEIEPFRAIKHRLIHDICLDIGRLRKEFPVGPECLGQSARG
jgi:hypothetical protein